MSLPQGFSRLGSAQVPRASPVASARRASAVLGGKSVLLAVVGVIFLLSGSTFAVYAVSPIAFTSPNSQTGGEFGYSVATDSGTVVVSAWNETVGGNVAAGRVYTFS